MLISKRKVALFRENEIAIGVSRTPKRNTKLFCMFVVSFVLLSCIFGASFTVSARTYEDFEYKALENGTVEITGYNGSATTVVIPEKINDYIVTSVGYNAFYNGYFIEEIHLPSTINYIYGAAFSGTGYYKNDDNWEDGVLYIDNYLIDAHDRKLPSELQIKEGTVLIAEGAFENCDSLEQITIPNSVIHIGNCAFKDCDSLKSIVIPDSVTNFEGFQTFSSCDALESAVIGNGIKKIGDGTFEECVNLTNVTIGENVTRIGGGAFAHTSIENLEIPDSVETISYRAFFMCNFLTTVKIGSGVKEIGEAAINGNNIKQIIYNGSPEEWEQIEIGKNNDFPKDIEYIQSSSSNKQSNKKAQIKNDHSETKSPSVSVVWIIVSIVLLLFIASVIFWKFKKQPKNGEH